jgi:hypothetical protein
LRLIAISFATGSAVAGATAELAGATGETARAHQAIKHLATLFVGEVPQTLCLRECQMHAWHFVEFGVDDPGEGFGALATRVLTDGHHRPNSLAANPVTELLSNLATNLPFTSGRF